MNPLVLSLALATQGPAHPPAPPVPLRPVGQPFSQPLLAPPLPGAVPNDPRFHRTGYPGPVQVVPSYRPPYPGMQPGYPAMQPGYPPIQANYPVLQPAIAVPPPMPHHAPMTLEQFAHCFKPTPGTHHVCLIHPCTGQPVKVCFTLPPGCPKVEVRRHRIEFDYGRREVDIHFESNGTVHVHND